MNKNAFDKTPAGSGASFQLVAAGAGATFPEGRQPKFLIVQATGSVVFTEAADGTGTAYTLSAVAANTKLDISPGAILAASTASVLVVF